MSQYYYAVTQPGKTPQLRESPKASDTSAPFVKKGSHAQGNDLERSLAKLVAESAINLANAHGNNSEDISMCLIEQWTIRSELSVMVQDVFRKSVQRLKGGRLATRK